MPSWYQFVACYSTISLQSELNYFLFLSFFFFINNLEISLHSYIRNIVAIMLSSWTKETLQLSHLPLIHYSSSRSRLTCFLDVFYTLWSLFTRRERASLYVMLKPKIKMISRRPWNVIKYVTDATLVKDPCPISKHGRVC